MKRIVLLSCIGFLPPNNLKIPVSQNKDGLSESQYHKVIDKVERVYRKVAEDYGGELKIDRKWESPTVNAGTFRDEGGKHWHVNLYGGLPRHPTMTEDGFALVICHELGHHIGGFPKKIINRRTHWSSAEGQADYWATLKCLRRLFENDDNETLLQGVKIPQTLTKYCELSFGTRGHRDLCKRIGLAGVAVANLNASATNSTPSLDTPSQEVVSATYEKHPKPQCRLDTYFQGTICDDIWENWVSQTEEMKGTCHSGHGHTIGLRPSCWFKEKGQD